MNIQRLIQLSIYEILEIIPPAILAAAPFWGKIRSHWAMGCGMGVLYFLGILRRMVWSQQFSSSMLSILWIIVYIITYCFVIQTSISKLLFVLTVILNYTSLISIIYTYVGSQLFPEQVTIFPYCYQTSLTIFLAMVTTFPLLFYMFYYRVGPLMNRGENDRIWSFLWLVPTIFYGILYYNYFSSTVNRTQNYLFSIVIGVGSFFVVYLVLRMVKENELVLRLKAENYLLALTSMQYENLKSRMEETYRARHDLRQCMTVIQSYLQNGNLEDLQRFTAEYYNTLPDQTPIIYCKNSALNAVMFYYADLAKQQGIAFEAKVEYPEKGGIPDTDLVVLFGNLLENAVEACERQQEGQHFVRLVVRWVKDTILVVMENSYTGNIQYNDDGFTSSKRLGKGIGITSVRKIAEKYHGITQFQFCDNVFHARILIKP